MKRRIRLTESQLHNVIKESVKRVISEINIVGKIDNFDRNKSIYDTEVQEPSNKSVRQPSVPDERRRNISDKMKQHREKKRQLTSIITSRLTPTNASFFNRCFTFAYFEGDNVKLQFEDDCEFDKRVFGFDSDFMDILDNLKYEFDVVGGEYPKPDGMSGKIGFITIKNPIQ